MEADPPPHRNGSAGQCVADPAIGHLVSEFLQYRLAQSGYQWRGAFLSLNSVQGGRHISPKVGIALQRLADEFMAQYKDQFVEMCQRLTVDEDNLKDSLEGVANELFSEGVKWPRIVALFVFTSELAIQCVNQNCENLLNALVIVLSSYITERLSGWINEHEGWDGLLRFEESTVSAKDRRWPSVKNLLCLGISALGVISLGAVLTKS